MKKLALLFVIIICCRKSFAQDTVYLKKEDQKTIYTDRQPQAIFVELFGRALDISVNYDRRFLKQVDGWGFSVGIGTASTNGYDNNSNTSENSSSNIYAFPISINYLKGRNGKYLEMGAGITYFTGTVDDLNNIYTGGNSVIGTFTIGYRNQPIKGGFMFRTGLNPIISKNTFYPIYPYVSFGYDF